MSPTEPSSKSALRRFTEACNYPGVIDEAAVDAQLRRYLQALGIKRDVRQLQRGWKLENEPALKKYVDEVLA
jgi:hypothetical protein